MRRNISQFVLIVLLGATLPAAALLSAPPCYSQQDQQDQHNQPGQSPAQPAAPPHQPPPDAAPPSRPTSTPDSGQDPSQESSSKKALPPDDSASTKTPADAAKKSKAGVLPPEDDPAWDPFHAQQDIDVGMFYLHKGDVDAAIARFEDAISRRANFAKPRLLLAECYEKKGDPSEAVRYYKEYLQVLPNAPDAKKVREKIDKLSKK
jgi:tetratricopeptide (TPR) repeat protein